MRTLHIPEISYPGTWLAFEDQATDHEVLLLLHFLEDRVVEAAISLGLFQDSLPARETVQERWEADRALEAGVRKMVAEISGNKLAGYLLPFATLQSLVLARRRETGSAPWVYEHKLPFIHAHSFVFALDSFGKFLDAICEVERISEVVAALRDAFNGRLPMLRKIRNSAAHAEDRTRRYGKPEDKKAGKKMAVEGFLGLSNLNGYKLGYTIDDGSYQEIEVSQTNLQLMVDTLNRVLEALPWTGPARVAP